MHAKTFSSSVFVPRTVRDWNSLPRSRVLQKGRDRQFSPCTKAYHAGYKFWINIFFGTTLNVSTIETERFLLAAIKCSENAGYAVSRGGACLRTPLDAPISPLTSILSPPTMLHLGEPLNVVLWKLWKMSMILQEWDDREVYNFIHMRLHQIK